MSLPNAVLICENKTEALELFELLQSRGFTWAGNQPLFHQDGTPRFEVSFGNEEDPSCYRIIANESQIRYGRRSTYTTSMRYFKEECEPEDFLCPVQDYMDRYGKIKTEIVGLQELL